MATADNLHLPMESLQPEGPALPRYGAREDE